MSESPNFEQTKLNAERGDIVSQFNLAVMFHFGIHVDEDHEQAAAWYLKAARQGHLEAQCNLGMMYLTGDGVNEDHAQAFKWTSAAAQQGDMTAQFNLALRYNKGEGVNVDYAEAAKWAQRSAEQGYAVAQGFLGSLYGVGKGVPQDNVLSYKWVCLAARQGDKGSIEQRQVLERLLAYDQVVEGQRLAASFVPAQVPDLHYKSDSLGNDLDCVTDQSVSSFLIGDQRLEISDQHIDFTASRSYGSGKLNITGEIDGVMDGFDGLAYGLDHDKSKASRVYRIRLRYESRCADTIIGGTPFEIQIGTPPFREDRAQELHNAIISALHSKVIPKYLSRLASLIRNGRCEPIGPFMLKADGVVLKEKTWFSTKDNFFPYRDLRFQSSESEIAVFSVRESKLLARLKPFEQINAVFFETISSFFVQR